MRNTYKTLIVKSEWRKPLERLRLIWEDNIKVDHKKVIGRNESMDWIIKEII
jgi:hypothetical protein